MNLELDVGFVSCYRCYRQPISDGRHPFVVCVCKHIFCDDCRRSDRRRTRDSMYCFICRKPVKFKPITPQDLPASVRSSFESTERLPEQFESVAEFQEEIQNNFTDELMKGIAYWDKVGDKHDAQAKVLEARCRQLEDGISNVEAKSMKHMARERYTELLNMADYELDRMNYRELVGASTVENRAPCSTPRFLNPSVSAIDPDTPLLRQVLLKNAYSSSSYSPR